MTRLAGLGILQLKHTPSSTSVRKSTSTAVLTWGYIRNNDIEHHFEMALAFAISNMSYTDLLAYLQSEPQCPISKIFEDKKTKQKKKQLTFFLFLKYNICWGPSSESPYQGNSNHLIQAILMCFNSIRIKKFEKNDPQKYDSPSTKWSCTTFLLLLRSSFNSIGRTSIKQNSLS